MTVSLVSGAAFLAVGGWLVSRGRLPGDDPTVTALHALNSGTTHDIMVGVRAATDLLPLVPVAVVTTLVLFVRGSHRDAGYFVAAVVGVWALNPMLKRVFERPRPDAAASYESVSAYSFPSGHAANTAALAGALLMVLPASRLRYGAALVGAAVLVSVGLAQLVLAVHFPSDLVAGWLVAAAWVAAVWATRARLDRGEAASDRDASLFHRD